MTDVRERIQKLLVTGDNRLKQGVDSAKARESYEQALAVAREAGLEEARLAEDVRPGEQARNLGVSHGFRDQHARAPLEPRP